MHATRPGEVHERRQTPLFFNAAHLPLPTEQYVAWVDVMGTQTSMSTSLRTAANFMFKLHIADIPGTTRARPDLPSDGRILRSSAEQG